MMMTRYITIAGLIGTIAIAGCNSGKVADTNTDVMPPVTVPHTDTMGISQKVSMVISSIPFPTNIFDSLHYVHGQYKNNMTNPVENASTYSQSNAQAINLGIYGADLSYVISFEQFNQVGAYMKATKYLADKVGVPMAFTEDVIERCQKNSNNKDSLIRIVYSSYGIIDQKLKDDRRKSTEVLVLAGGWLEGLYITTESFSTISAVTDRQGAYNILMDQKRYLDILLNQLDLISDSPYCTDISTGLHDIRSVYNNAIGTSMSNGVIQNLAEKAANLRARKLVKEVYMDEKIEKYILDIVFSTRSPKEYKLDKYASMISYGGSPRASISMAYAAKAYAFIKRRGYVIPEDVRAICHDVLRHRIGLTYEAEAENITSENIITDILNTVEVP